MFCTSIWLRSLDTLWQTYHFHIYYVCTAMVSGDPLKKNKKNPYPINENTNGINTLYNTHGESENTKNVKLHYARRDKKKMLIC